MSLKWAGMPDWCKHGNYEDNCEMCAKDNKTEKLEEVFRIAKLFVNCEYPEGCTKDNWFSEIDKFADQRSLLENELIEAINKIESPEDVIPIKNDYKYEIQALLDEEADQEPRLQKERAKLDNVMTQLGRDNMKPGQGCDPHSKPPTVSGKELFDFLHLCRCHLYLRNFTSDAENVKIKARIDDWLYTYKDELDNKEVKDGLFTH